MKIKILVVPTLIIAAGFVTLNYLKPDFDIYMQKKAQRDVAKENALQAEQVAQNVQALRGDMQTQAEKVTFVKKYLPMEKDQGRTFDSLNFLTSQAGLLTSKIQTSDKDEAATEQAFATIDPVANADPLAPVGEDGVALPGLPAAPVYTAPKVKNYIISIEALGAYPNIKDLLSKITAFDRLQKITSFKVAVVPTEAEEGGAGNTLTMTYVAELPYQALPAAVSGEGIVAIPGFTQGNFNFEAVDKIRASATAVPEVVLGTDGKSNPFVE